ncbi:MAG: flagellar hook-associated protein FlgK [Planctomycetes bacterium]|nr:flagellar hook-associated protein FlgK [Planctomycetota bacterium]
MADYSIGITGLQAAQNALSIIGNNIANATTDGYHRQRVELSPAFASQIGDTLVGGGVTISSVTRLVDNLLESELLKQESILASVSQEFSTLRTIENVLGELGSETSGLNLAIDRFFNALQDLSSHPGETIWQNQVVREAEALSIQFSTLGDFLTNLESQFKLETDNLIESVNALATNIATLNGNIKDIEVGGGQVNNLRDKRDAYLTDLSKLVRIQTMERDYGVVDVTVAGIPLVTTSTTVAMEAGYDDDGNLGISIANSFNYITSLDGGRIGGLLSLKNTLVSNIHTDLDSLAATLVDEVNKYHVQGVGSFGSFSTLTGEAMASESLSDYTNVSDGSIFIRVTNTSSGAITHNEVTIDKSSDTLSTVAAAIALIDGVDALVASSQLSITADANYKFDFIPAVLSSPSSSTFADGTPPTVTVSGIYTGTTNQTFSLTVSTTGTKAVGNDTIQIVVKDGGGSTVKTVNVGSGYAAGDSIDIGNGLKIALTTGNLTDADVFTIKAYGDTDTADLLSTLGLNTFFTGSDASTMAVSSTVSSDPSRIATSLGADMTDNANASRLFGLNEETFSDLGSLKPGDFYRKMVTDIGQQVSLKAMREDNLDAVVANLLNQQAEVSGVDINEEAAQMLIYEQMFQAMAKYMRMVQSTMESLMEIV